MHAHRWTAALAVLALAACATRETPEQMQARMQAESDSARQALEANIARWATFFNAGNADSLAMFYAPDARTLPPGMPMVSGRDSIRAMLAGYFAAGKTEGATFQVQSVSANGPIAVERGTFRMTFTTTGGQPMTSAGKYLAHWRRMDGQWQMVEDIWNDDAPPPPPAPTRRR